MTLIQVDTDVGPSVLHVTAVPIEAFSSEVFSACPSDSWGRGTSPLKNDWEPNTPIPYTSYIHLLPFHWSSYTVLCDEFAVSSACKGCIVEPIAAVTSGSGMLIL